MTHTSLLQGDMLDQLSSAVDALVDRYEMPTPLHKLNSDELQQLHDALQGVLETWNNIRKTAEIAETPGFLTLVATEYGCIHSLLQFQHIAEAEGETCKFIA